MASQRAGLKAFVTAAGVGRPSSRKRALASSLWLVQNTAVAGAPVYIVHLTCREALDVVHKARALGQPVFAETCPQYLYLSAANADQPGDAAAAMKR